MPLGPTEFGAEGKVFTDMVVGRIRDDAENFNDLANQGRQMGRGVFKFRQHVIEQIFSGLLVDDLEDTEKVVHSGGNDLELLRRPVKGLADQVDRPEDPVTNSRRLDLRQVANGVEDTCLRIGKVEQEGIRTNLFDIRQMGIISSKLRRAWKIAPGPPFSPRQWLNP